MAGLCLKGILGGCRAITGATWWPPPARDEVTEFLPDIPPAQLAAMPQPPVSASPQAEPPVSASPQPAPGRGRTRSHRAPGPRPAVRARGGGGLSLVWTSPLGASLSWGPPCLGDVSLLADTPSPFLMLDAGNVSRVFREEESEEGGR